MSDIFTIHTDGGSRGNPGPAAFAYTIERPGQPPIEEKGYLGDTTNNIAEYAALVMALQHAHELDAHTVVVNSDSELMVQQMKGKYKVKNPGILPLYQEASRLVKLIGNVKIIHIYREHNSRADRLCNDALDDRHSLPIIEPLAKRAGSDSDRKSELAVKREKASPVADAPVSSMASEVRPAAIAILKDAAQAWADDEDDAPTPEEIWDRIETLLRTRSGR